MINDVNEITIPGTEVLQSITAEQAWHYMILPKYETTDSMEFYVASIKYDKHLADELAVLFGKQIKLYPVHDESLRKVLIKYYRQSEDISTPVKPFSYESEDAVHNLISEADVVKCSDIHLEAFEKKCRIRFRVDGKLIERYVLNKERYPELMNKIKVLANLDISEKRLPQDGRISYESTLKKFDIRVSVLPSMYGEKIVLRLLARETADLDIRHLGFSKKQLEQYLDGIQKPHGMVLISGPTGSGKTTTLYSTLKILNNVEKNIITIEDPVEYTLEGITQVQLREQIGLTFSHALRSFLRQDPDIIMLGEIRDSETANLAVRASLTGHLILSTVHTNSALGTVTRLLDMGIPPFLLAETLNISVAQRLVRILCNHCKRKETGDAEMLPKWYKHSMSTFTFYSPVGCEHCYYTGYRGRKAIYEVISIDEDIKKYIHDGDFNEQPVLRQKKVNTLTNMAVELFISGETSFDEIYSYIKNV